MTKKQSQNLKTYKRIPLKFTHLSPISRWPAVPFSQGGAFPWKLRLDSEPKYAKTDTSLNNSPSVSDTSGGEKPRILSLHIIKADLPEANCGVSNPCIEHQGPFRPLQGVLKRTVITLGGRLP